MQKNYKIAVIPGDGTGPEVVADDRDIGLNIYNDRE